MFHSCGFVYTYINSDWNNIWKAWTKLLLYFSTEICTWKDIVFWIFLAFQKSKQDNLCWVQYLFRFWVIGFNSKVLVTEIFLAVEKMSEWMCSSNYLWRKIAHRSWCDSNPHSVSCPSDNFQKAQDFSAKLSTISWKGFWFL